MIHADLSPKIGPNRPFLDLTVKLEVQSPKTFSILSQQPLLSKNEGFNQNKVNSSLASFSYIDQVTKYTSAK